MPPPFAAWEYRPPYLPDPLAIHVAENARHIREPFLFYMAFLKPPVAAESPPPLEHAAGFRVVTSCGVRGPDYAADREPTAAVERTGPVRFTAGESMLLELGFDGETRGQSQDFRPGLPLQFHW